MGDVQEITCLNKIFCWVKDDSGEAIEIEADPRHVEIICVEMKLAKTSKAVVTPGVKLPEADLGKDLHGDEQTAFRSVVMRASYLAEDRPDIRYATKEAARLMSQRVGHHNAEATCALSGRSTAPRTKIRKTATARNPYWL